MNEGKETLEYIEEKPKKIKDLPRSITSHSGNHDEKYMKIKFNSGVRLPLKKSLKLYNTIVIARSVFYEGNKYYQQVFLDECLYKWTAMLAE